MLIRHIFFLFLTFFFMFRELKQNCLVKLWIYYWIWTAYECHTVQQQWSSNNLYSMTTTTNIPLTGCAFESMKVSVCDLITRRGWVGTWSGPVEDGYWRPLQVVGFATATTADAVVDRSLLRPATAALLLVVVVVMVMMMLGAIVAIQWRTAHIEDECTTHKENINQWISTAGAHIHTHTHSLTHPSSSVRPINLIRPSLAGAQTHLQSIVLLYSTFFFLPLPVE